MKEFLQPLLALIVIIPYLVTILFYLLMKVSGHSSVKSFRVGADVTVPFLFVSVCVLLPMVVQVHITVILTIGVLVIAIGYTIIERVRSKDFRTKLLIRNLWRMLFVILSILYMLVLLAGLVKTVVEFLMK